MLHHPFPLFLNRAAAIWKLKTISFSLMLYSASHPTPYPLKIDPFLVSGCVEPTTTLWTCFRHQNTKLLTVTTLLTFKTIYPQSLSAHSRMGIHSVADCFLPRHSHTLHLWLIYLPLIPKVVGSINDHVDQKKFHLAFSNVHKITAGF